MGKKKKDPPSPAQLFTRARLREMGLGLAQRMGTAVRPIYFEPAEDALEAIGSCVLLRIDDLHLLVTAAHVIDWRMKGPIAVAGARDIYFLPDQFQMSALPEARKTDKLDFAFCELPRELVDHLELDCFVTPTEIDLAEGRTEHFEFFTALGFPVKQQGRDLATFKFRPELTIFSDREVETQTYDRLGYNRGDHWVMRFDTQRVMSPDGTIKALVDQKGISGGGVWRRSILSSDPSEGRLAAITYYVQTGGTRILVATRMRVIAAGICQVYPEVTGAFFP